MFLWIATCSATRRTLCVKIESETVGVPATVLIVEDDFDAREVLAILLRFEGFNVVTAEDGFAGLNTVQSQQVDLVITDIEMPQLDGIELIKRLRAQDGFSALPIIVVSACDRRLMRKAIAAGASHTMRKPARFDLLTQTVNGLLRLTGNATNSH